MIQWHPLFAQLLRPLVESHYDVQTGMPVGDVPRSADLVLLRRTTTTAPPFRGLWRHLTIWNVLEFKGPTVSARVNDLDLLIELGLGIGRRLAEERRRQREAAIDRGEISFWYLANHPGRRFLRDARKFLEGLTPLGPGVWQAAVLGRPLLLASNRDLPVEPDTVPVHLLVKEEVEKTRAVAQEVAAEPELWRLYGGWVLELYPDLSAEVREMARAKGHGPNLNWRPVIEAVGLKQLIQEIGPKPLLDEVGVDRIVKEVGPERILDVAVAQLTPKQLRELKKRLP
jgi:hypothetical protein